MIWAVLTICAMSGNVSSCSTWALPEPYRTMGDCLLAVDKADQGLRRVRADLAYGACTSTPAALSNPR